MSAKLTPNQGMALGVQARMRAAGMAALLAEILAHNAAREFDEDLKDRIKMAIGDQDDATAASSRVGTNTGHGHVWERPDRVKARCGGPSLGCPICIGDQQLVK